MTYDDTILIDKKEISYFSSNKFKNFLNNLTLTNERLARIEDKLFGQIIKKSHTKKNQLSEKEFLNELNNIGK